MDNPQIEVVPIDSVRLWGDNPRKNDKAVKRLQKILKVHGQVTPIVVWRKDGTIRKGNTTWKSMKANGDKTIAVLFKDFKSEADATAYAIADNKSSEFAEWDDNILAKLMESAELTSEHDLESLGFTEKEMASILMSGIEIEKLPPVDIQGEQVNVSQVLLIQFDTEEEMEFFRTQVMGINVKHQKVVQFKDLLQKLRPIFRGTMFNAPVNSEKPASRKPRC
jgi:hypothetical protein